jgi:hypothetical protein
VKHLDPGHLVIAEHGRRRDVLIGTVTEQYVYRDDLIPDHPHTFEVAWGQQVQRRVLDEGGMQWPPRAVVAITDVALRPTTLDVVRRAATSEIVGTPTSRRHRTKLKTNTLGVRRRAVGISGNELLARVPRRMNGRLRGLIPISPVRDASCLALSNGVQITRVTVTGFLSSSTHRNLTGPTCSSSV